MKVLRIVFVIYLAILIYVLFFKGSYGNTLMAKETGLFSRERIDILCNFIPFNTLKDYILRMHYGTINTGIVIKNLVGNLLLFAPMGVFVPVLFGNIINKYWKFLILIIVIVVLFEVIQFVSARGTADIDDLILNTAGASLFYFITKIPFIKRLVEKK